MDVPGNAPIIIKRKKVVAGGGHHGGAWKVAYADFVTAMMAFFMLMWLLNATTEKQRKGIADYFSPTIPINRISGGGDGAFGGSSIFSEDAMAQNGTGATQKKTARGDASMGDRALGTKGENAEAEQAKNVVDEALLAFGGESDVHKDMLRHIVTRVTDEGLVIELFDLPDRPLFLGLEPQPVLVELSQTLGPILDLVSNDVAVGAHSRAHPVVLSKDPAWALTTDRVQVFRGMTLKAGLAPDRLARLVGYGDRKPVAPMPMDVRNNRIEVTLLRSDL